MYLYLFIAHKLLCAKTFCFIAYICFVYCTLLHFIVRTWAQVSCLHGLCKNSLSTVCPSWLTHQQVKAGKCQ